MDEPFHPQLPVKNKFKQLLLEDDRVWEFKVRCLKVIDKGEVSG